MAVGSGTVPSTPYHCSRSVYSCAWQAPPWHPGRPLHAWHCRRPAGRPFMALFLVLQAPSIGRPRPLFPGDEMVCMHQLILLETVRPAVHCMHACMGSLAKTHGGADGRARGEDTAHAPRRCHVRVLNRRRVAMAHTALDRANRQACMHA